MTFLAIAVFITGVALSVRAVNWAGSTRLTHREADRIAYQLGPDFSALDVLDYEAHGRLDDMFALLDKNR